MKSKATTVEVNLTHMLSVLSATKRKL